MIQTSLVGFAVGGAFLSLAYFDVPYYLAGILVATRVLVEQRLRRPARRACRDEAPVAAVDPGLPPGAGERPTRCSPNRSTRAASSSSCAC